MDVDNSPSVPEPANISQLRLTLKKIFVVFMVFDLLILIFCIISACLFYMHLQDCIPWGSWQNILLLIITPIGFIVTVIAYIGCIRPNGPLKFLSMAKCAFMWQDLVYVAVIITGIMSIALISRTMRFIDDAQCLRKDEIRKAYLALNGVTIFLSVVCLCVTYYAMILIYYRNSPTNQYIPAAPVPPVPVGQLQPVDVGMKQPPDSDQQSPVSVPTSSGPQEMVPDAPIPQPVQKTDVSMV